MKVERASKRARCHCYDQLRFASEPAGQDAAVVLVLQARCGGGGRGLLGTLHEEGKNKNSTGGERLSDLQNKEGMQLRRAG